MTQAGRPLPQPEVRRALAADVPELVEMLARAFDDDPVPNFLFRGDRRRRRGLRRFFSIQMRHMYLGDGEMWTTADKAGAALWAPPSKPRPGLGDLLRLLPVLPDLLGLGRDAGTAAHLLQSVERARPHQEHWYLATLGTDPQRQGQGVGSALLREVLEKVDSEGLPAYLESSKERNVPFYARHGFEVTGEIHTPRGGPTLWLMWREPVSHPESNFR
ncbi:MAG TPA: GNAT family N-acetyltransferase [Acidimicrobiales bacterium]|nr:GNAT family N-acetyltransferase [Acidimicrobiales bacterium]